MRTACVGSDGAAANQPPARADHAVSKAVRAPPCGTELATAAGMTALERILPAPAVLEIDGVDLGVPLQRAWELVRHGDLAHSRLVRALFAIRTLPDRLHGRREPLLLSLDDFASTPERPGFAILVDDPPHEVVVGAIGKVWQPEIPFEYVDGSAAFAAFCDPGFVKVAWALQLRPLGDAATHVSLELRVEPTDEAASKRFRTYWRLIGPASQFIRRSLLSALARENGTPESRENERPLPGDELMPDAVAQVTHAVTVNATPEQVWPWLMQMGCHRGGFYSIDALDNGFERSAREIHPELQLIEIGDVLPASPAGDGGFEVLRLEPHRVLCLGGLYDAEAERQLPFAAERPEDYWHATWSFVLEPVDGRTRLHARARVAHPDSGRLHASWVRFAHQLMQTTQLRHLAARIEGRQPRDDWRDVGEGIGGAGIMVAAMLTPFLRHARSHWGLDAATALRWYPGDEIVREPRWSWTHGIEIDAPAAEVWPWVAQIGADRAGFYSYQWLENVAGCELRNAETLHPEWEAHLGGELSLTPNMPPLRIVSLVPGEYFVAHAAADPNARAAGTSWAEATWVFHLEPLGEARCRFISRYRVSCSEDIATRIQFGAPLVEPIGFAMDRKMLLGVKERAEAAAERRGLGHARVKSA
jgi:hypothetical protein